MPSCLQRSTVARVFIPAAFDSATVVVRRLLVPAAFRGVADNGRDLCCWVALRALLSAVEYYPCNARGRQGPRQELAGVGRLSTGMSGCCSSLWLMAMIHE